MDFSAICDESNANMYRYKCYYGYLSLIPILRKIVTRGVRASASIILAWESKNPSNMDEWCISVIQDMFPDNRHLITLVGLIVFLQQYLKMNGAFQA